MNAKTLFLQNKELAQWWSSVVDNPNYERVMLHASAAVFESTPSAESRSGILQFREMLATMSEADSEAPELPSPKLRHPADLHRRTVEAPKSENK
jgi:hypothetical protein